jgi:hypothetical protein
LPGQLEARLAEFVDYYNPWCHHESLRNLTRLRSQLHHWRKALGTSSTSTPMRQIFS